MALMKVKEMLTESQKNVLDFIRSRCQTTGVAPSYREIQAHFGYRAVGTVQDHIRALVKKGFLENSRNRRPARGLIPKNYVLQGARRVPVYGEIAAGSARMAEQLEIGTLLVSEEKAPPNCFGLRVRGDSMVDAGIYEGDHLLIEPATAARNGDIVVALLNGETTVKRYMKVEEEIFLVPENKSMRPIRVQGSLQIQGKVIGLQRNY
jgi:repressor LexA